MSVALMASRATLRIPETVWTPISLGGSLTAWYDAVDGTYVTHSGSPDLVSQWDDRSGNGYHATQSTSTNRPTWGAATNRITFDGSNDRMVLPAGISFSTTSRCVAAIGRVETGETGNQVLIGPTGNNAFGFFLRSTDNKCGIVDANNSFFAQGSVTSTAADHVFLGNLTSSTWRVSLDGTATTGSHSRTFAAGQTGYIGVEFIGVGQFLDHLYGNLGELVIATEISETNQQKLEGYLAWRWGLEGSLPGDHPYKSAAPTV